MAKPAAKTIEPPTEKVKTPTAPAATSGATVTVGCKLPLGLYLQLQRKRMEREETPGGYKERVYFDKYGQRYHINGPAIPSGSPPAGYRVPTIVGGSALTSGIPKDFWEEWLEQNKDAPYVQSGMIFAAEKRSDVAAEAREKVDIKSGFEPLNPKGDPRMPKPMSSGVGPIETADGRAIPAAQDDVEGTEDV